MCWEPIPSLLNNPYCVLDSFKHMFYPCCLTSIYSSSYYYIFQRIVEGHNCLPLCHVLQNFLTGHSIYLHLGWSLRSQGLDPKRSTHYTNGRLKRVTYTVYAVSRCNDTWKDLSGNHEKRQRLFLNSFNALPGHSCSKVLDGLYPSWSTFGGSFSVYYAVVLTQLVNTK